MSEVKESILVFKYPNITAESKGKTSKRKYITPKLFEDQILWMLDWKYSPVTADEFKSFLFEGAHLQKKSYLILLEGGYKNIKTQAYNILKRYRIPVLIFLSPNYIGDKNRWEDSQEEMLSVDDISELNKTRMVTFGLHSKSYKDLTRCSDEELFDEIVRGKTLLEEIINYKVDFLSYPYGRANDNVKNKVEEAGIKMAFINRNAQISDLEEFMAIPSIRISQYDGWLGLIYKLRKLEK